MAQRLVRKLCDRCKVDGTLTEKQAHTLNIDMSRLAQGQIEGTPRLRLLPRRRIQGPDGAV